MAIDLDHEVALAASHLPRDVRSAIDSLTPRQRQAIVMVWIHGWTEEEFAAELGVSHQAVNKSCKLAIEGLQKNLKIKGCRK